MGTIPPVSTHTAPPYFVPSFGTIKIYHIMDSIIPFSDNLDSSDEPEGIFGNLAAAAKSCWLDGGWQGRVYISVFFLSCAVLIVCLLMGCCCVGPASKNARKPKKDIEVSIKPK